MIERAQRAWQHAMQRACSWRRLSHVGTRFGMGKAGKTGWRHGMMIAMVLLMTACSWPGSGADDDKKSRRLYISGNSEHVSDKTIARIAQPYLKASFFSMDTQALKAELADNPWLAKVRVARHWPDGVTVHVEDRVPLALWRGEYVMDDQGEVFKPEKLPKGLVELIGPEDDRDEIYKQYRRLSAILAGKEAHLAALKRDDYGNWLAYLDNGLELRLGREHISDRMQRFVDYALTSSRARRALAEAGYVDLRYKDGFAVGGVNTRIARRPRMRSQLDE